MNNSLRKVIAGIALLMAFEIPGPDDWTTYQKNNVRSGRNSANVSGGLKMGWSKHSDHQWKTPFFQFRSFFLTETWEGGFKVSSILKSTGIERWNYVGTGNLSSEIVIHSEGLYIQTDTKLLSLNSTTGQVRWQKEGGGSPFLFPAAYEDLLYVWQKTGPSTYLFQSIRAIDGKIRWLKQFTDVAEVNYPSITYDGRVYAPYNGNDGKVHINYFSSSGHVDTILSPGQAISPLVLGFDFAIYSAQGGKIVVIDTEDMLVVGEIDSGDFVSVPTMNEEKYYYLSKNLLSGELSLNSVLPVYEMHAEGNPYTLEQERKVLGAGAFLGDLPEPVLMGDQIFFPTGNEVWRASFLNGLKKSKTDYNISKLVFADGEFMGLSSDGHDIFSFTLDPSIADQQVTMSSPYNTGSEYSEFVGQLHSHYVPDIKIPGQKVTPSTTVNKYKEAGYDFIALTEHNKIIPNPGVDGITFIENSEEDTQGWGGNHILAIGVANSINENESDQKRIDNIVGQNGFSSLSHPNSAFYPWNVNNLFGLNSYSALEVYNSAMDKAGKYLEILRDLSPMDNAFAFDKWDELLSKRKKVFATVGDDFTPNNPGFDNAAVAVFAKNNSQAEILANLKSGNYYLLQGTDSPRLDINISSSEIKVTSNETAAIRFIGKNGEILDEQEEAQAASYQPEGGEIYIRAEVEDSDGNISWTQPIFVDLPERSSRQGEGVKTLALGEATLQADTTADLNIETLPADENPAAQPRWGYFSPVYNLSTAGALRGQADLTISYAPANILGSEDDLSIFTYDDARNAWQKIASVVDKVNKKVTAKLDHFSYYVLSSNLEADSIPPQIVLVNVADLKRVGGEAEIALSVTDNSSVYNVSGYLDKKTLLFSDSQDDDGFDNTVDFSQFPIGDHNIKIIATDLFGNSSEQNFRVKVVPQSEKPQIIIQSKVLGRNKVCGSFSLKVASRGGKSAEKAQIYLGNTLLGEIDITGGQDPTIFNTNDGMKYSIKVMALGQKYKFRRVIKITQTCTTGKDKRTTMRIVWL